MRSSNPSRSLALLAAFLLVLGACSADDAEQSTPTTAGSGADITEGEPAGERGWLDGNPAEADAEFAKSFEGDMDDDAMEDGASRVELSAPESATSADAIAPPVDSGPTRAGSIDDNDDLADFLAYLDRIDDLGIAVRPVDVSEQHRIVVTGSNGRPVAGVSFEVRVDNEPIGSIRTGADGVALLHPRAWPTGQGEGPLELVDIDGQAYPVDRAGTAAIDIELDRPGGVDGSVPLDVLFLIDATGSMGDEIDRLKDTVDQVASRASSLDVPVDLRLGLTVYRDTEDAYLTRTFDFTGDVVAFQDALADVVADGGGDYPEALDEALADALAKPSWRSPDTTTQLIFLIADAPPQVERSVDTPYDLSLLEASARGIRIFPIASSGSDDQAEYVFRQLAQFTGSRFVFLSYGVGGAAVGESSDIESVDYEELPLEDLIVRLISEELADLTGEDVRVEPAPTTSTTEGQ